MPDPDPFELPAPVLEEALARLVGDDAAAREKALAELLAQHPAHSDQLRALHDTLGKAGRLLANTFAPPAAAEPERIDVYRIVRRLGEGAFGVVYLGEQDEPIRRQIALKLLRPGAGDRGTLARFDAERRFLARLQHPAIAQIFDAGLLADGRPWFVMEHVPGVPITEYCDRAQLPIDARLSLFARLCQGVQHAHEQGIVHRDLKPANVLVVEIDAEAQPKIIDFGIAKALEQRGEQHAVRTETGRVVGTPGYMSPEQADGRLDEVDARSDLFSLGVLLYELLTGELPWGKRPDSTASDPPRPSVRVDTDTQEGTAIAQQRGSQPKKLARHLRGDLDWIVLKALSRERPRRYASALELAAEIHRHLRGEPVHAGPPSLVYRLRKLARRRRTALSTAAAVVVMAAIGLWFVTQARSEASSRGQDAESAVASLLARANDKQVIDTPGGEAVRKQLATDALAFYDRFLRDRPDDLAAREGRARTLWTLSQVHFLLGQFVQSERVAREAVGDSEALLATAPDDLNYARILANAERNLGRALFSLEQRAEGRSWFQRAVDRLDRCHAADPAKAEGLLVHALMELQSALDPIAEAAVRGELLARASEIQERFVRASPDSMEERGDLIRVELQRSTHAAQQGDLAGARTLLARTEPWLHSAAGLDPGTVASVHAMAAQLLAMEGDVTAAMARLEQAIEVGHAWVAKEPAKAAPLHQLVSALTTLGQLQQAASMDGDAIATYRVMMEFSDAWTARFPEDCRGPLFYTQAVHRLNHLRFISGRRGDLIGADADAQRARALLPRLAPLRAAERLRFTWSTLGGLGMVADALALEDADTVWAETAAAMDAARAHGPIPANAAAEFVMYAVCIARCWIDAGRAHDAEAVLTHAQHLIDEHGRKWPDVAFHAPDVQRQAARACAARGELGAAAAHAERAAADGDWRACVAAADASTAVWQAAHRTGDAATADHRERAIGHCQRAIELLAPMVATDPETLWVVVPLARTRIHLALAQRDAGAAVDTATLTAALDTLAAVRDEVHAAEWDEAVFAAGKALLAR